MIKAITENDELVNVKATKNGEIKVFMDNTETTINASVQTIGTTSSTITINKKVTNIEVANYSETADVTIQIGELSAVIGANIATTLIINKDVSNISLTSTEADTKVQLIVKGVE